MKRGLEEMSAEMSGPKKTKTVGNGEGSAELHGEQWTKVEKKKKKKIRKVESKMDVCNHFLGCTLFTIITNESPSCFLSMTPYYSFHLQNTHPRFMYSNVEIVKRHHAIAIDVSFFYVLFVRTAC